MHVHILDGMSKKWLVLGFQNCKKAKQSSKYTIYVRAFFISLLFYVFGTQKASFFNERQQGAN